MNGKKNRERFSIKFNENDPAHSAVIRLLEKQGPHSKAQFIVNAILHYINCPETPDISFPQALDRTAIEDIVMEILSQKDNTQRKINNGEDAKTETEREQTVTGTEGKTNEEQLQKTMNPAALALIADTMSAFRNN